MPDNQTNFVRQVVNLRHEINTRALCGADLVRNHADSWVTAPSCMAEPEYQLRNSQLSVQLRPDSGLGFQVKGLKTSGIVSCPCCIYRTSRASSTSTSRSIIRKLTFWLAGSHSTVWTVKSETPSSQRHFWPHRFGEPAHEK